MPAPRNLTLSEALAYLPDIKEWYRTGNATTNLKIRIPRDVLGAQDRTTWLIEILLDISCAVPKEDKEEFLDHRNSLLNELCL